MGLFGKFFGGGDSGLTCSFCQKGLMTLKSGSLSMTDMKEMMRKTGYRCFACDKVACGPCSFAAAQAQGKGRFICPSCSADIHDNLAR